MGNLVKKTGLAFASFGLATAAFAGSYTEGCDCEITIPKYAGGVRVGVEALYFAADIENTAYAFTDDTQNGVDTMRSHNVEHDSDWGWAVELAYVVAGTGNDFVLNYTDHSFKASNTISVSGNTDGDLNSMILVDINELDSLGFGSNSPILDSDEDLAYAKGSYDVDYHKIDFEAGQAIKIGRDSVCLRFHAGLRYASLDTKFQAYFADEDTDDNGAFNAESDYDGLGPRVGIDGAWHLGNNFSLVAEASAALLVGDASARQRYEDTDSSTPPTDYKWAHRVSFDNKIVSNLEARLGVSYSHHFSNSSELNLEVGYHVTNYFDVDYKNAWGTHDHDATDIAMSGLYLKADYTI